MPALPTGTVTFLFTDVERSTRLWEQHGDAMSAALACHDESLRAAIDDAGGLVFSTGGDGFAAAFSRAGDGVRAAIAAQRALAATSWPAEVALRVRMGLHTGEAQERDGNYFGAAVNRAARVMAVAHGGQILCSRATADVLHDALAADVSLVDLGEHRLRDLSRSERIFQVAADDLAREFPPLVSLDAFPGNLPLQVSSFIGRERELARVVAAIGDGRVVTLTGVGGVGKTRLALQAAAEMLPAFREGAWLVELAPVRDPEGVSGAFGSVFGVTPRAGQPLADALVEFLGTKQLLLVVDNCEHVLDAAADLVELIERSCTGVSIVATSREGLALEGERVVPVPSLSEPAIDADVATIAETDAVRLFVERALGVDPEFVLNNENAGAVAQICRRVDGIPLAIELAAARVTTMNAAELAHGLDHRFETLAGGRRRAVQRHQTLRAAIDWSYDLCSEDERRLLARLAVFAGGATRPAVEAVCAGAPIEAPTFDLLTSLVGRSLVVAERDHPETRYRLLETLREYGEERLAEHGETDSVRTRHAEYYSELARSIKQQIVGPGQVSAGERLLAEHENLIAAIHHAIDIDNVDLAMRLAYNVPGTQSQVGYPLILPVEPIVMLTGAAEHLLYPFAMAIAANQAGLRGDAAAGEALIQQALDAAHRLGDPERLVELIVWNTRVLLAFGRGATDVAAEYSERNAAIAREIGRRESLAIALGSAAMFHAMADEQDAALPLATEGLAVARELGAPGSIALNLMALAGALVERDNATARALLHESIEIRIRSGHETPGDYTQATLISARLEDWPQTLALAGPAIRTAHWMGHWALLAAVINVVARAIADDTPESAATLQGIARRLVATNRRTTLENAGPPANTPPAAPTTTEHPHHRDFVTHLRHTATAILRDRLTDVRLQELRAQGETMERPEAIAYALEVIAHQAHAN